MEKETDFSKKKRIKIKAVTAENKTLLLKKKFLDEDNDILILTNIINNKLLAHKDQNDNKKQINIASTNIIKFNEQNKKRTPIHAKSRKANETELKTLFLFSWTLCGFQQINVF